MSLTSTNIFFSNTSFKALMVLLVCLAFIGQAMASTTMAYQMMSMKSMSGKTQQPCNMSMMNMEKANNTAHTLSMSANSSSSEQSSEDCCAKSCNCFTGGCANIVVLIKDVSNEYLIPLSAKISSFSSLAQSQLSSSLYRPPILS